MMLFITTKKNTGYKIKREDWPISLSLINFLEIFSEELLTLLEAMIEHLKLLKKSLQIKSNTKSTGSLKDSSFTCHSCMLRM